MNHFNAEQGLYVTTDKKGFAKTSRYLGDGWQDNTGHASPYMGFEERWHWQPPQPEPISPEPLPEPTRQETNSYAGIFAIDLPVSSAQLVDCTCPTYTQITMPDGRYACEQQCDGSGQYDTLAECLQKHPQNPSNNSQWPPGYDGSYKIVLTDFGLPDGITHPDVEYGRCSRSTAGFYTAWAYSQYQPADVTSGDIFDAFVGSGTLFTEDNLQPRIGALPIVQGGDPSERWTPYGTPMVIDFTELGVDAELRELVQNEQVMSRLNFLQNMGPGLPPKLCTLNRGTWPTRVYSQGLMGIAEGEWTNCSGVASYGFTLPNSYPACFNAEKAGAGQDGRTTWCSWEVYTNSQTGATSPPPALPPNITSLNEFWTSQECPSQGTGQPYQDPDQPTGKYDRDFTNRELYYFRNSKPEKIKTINVNEPLRIVMSPQERQFLLTYGQKRQPKNFCKAVHFSRTQAQAGIPVTTQAENLLSSAYVENNIGQLNLFAMAFLTDAPQIATPIQIQITPDEPWLYSPTSADSLPYTVYMRNGLLSNALVDYGSQTLEQMLFLQDEGFKAEVQGIKQPNNTGPEFQTPKVIQPIKDFADATLLAFGVDTSKKKLKSL